MVQSRNPRPGVHPEPPADLPTRILPTVHFNTSLFRVHQTQYHPIYFGCSGENRFDAPNKEYKILYAAMDEFCAFRETIGRLIKYKIVTSELLESRRISEIHVFRPLTLINLTGAGLTRLDADGRLFTGDYDVAQRWGLAFWQHPEQPDGLYYRSRHDPSRYCIALYERIQYFLEVTITVSFLENKHRLVQIFDEYGYGFFTVKKLIIIYHRPRWYNTTRINMGVTPVVMLFDMF